MNAPYDLTTSYANANLDSAAATQTPNFIFSETQSTTSRITLFACKSPPLTCLLIKQWLLDTFSSDDLRAPGIVLAPLLHLLDHHHQLHLLTSLAPPSRHNARLYTYVRENFLRAIELPDSPDFLTAQSITDYCPSILDPNTALKRLEASEALHFGYMRPPDAWSLDLSDDRYLLHLHEAEREVASIAGLKCAEYLVVKRNFFRAFWTEIYRCDKKLFADSSEDELVAAASTASTSAAPPSTLKPQHVRSDNAHAVWLEKAYSMRKSRAHLVVVAWKELGFLDEQRFKAWVKAGGMFETSSEDEDEGGDVGEDRSLANLPPPLAARRGLY
ncbi:hypothetical protein BDY17DRAFT_322289 [Neohortaea acidophila]|uniref:Uncharacterized protein n=1 Tax=Neohortaea acidophila TaxID=245834 RepID=A0A6A6PZ22_9PEZI|nr:uncharacterized protein BDY17DRAFT_322289 [Neohortaea acidophila]KAF2485448.1 hypothetical protein BDY17DRAFT_322289 [Neohortaea acidophila]